MLFKKGAEPTGGASLATLKPPDPSGDPSGDPRIHVNRHLTDPMRGENIEITK